MTESCAYGSSRREGWCQVHTGHAAADAGAVMTVQRLSTFGGHGRL